jgi:hypothetical protein
MQAQATIDASNPDALMQALAEQIHSGLLTREEAKALLNDLSIEFDIDGTMIGVESLLTIITLAVSMCSCLIARPQLCLEYRCQLTWS